MRGNRRTLNPPSQGYGVASAQRLMLKLQRRYMIAENKSSLTDRRYRLRNLLDDLENRALAVTRGRAGEQCTNSVNGLAAAANDAADVSSSKLQLKNGSPAARNFGENHVVRKFNQLSNDELEKLSHVSKRLTTNPHSHNSYGMTSERQ
jgi:hypothetical protein